MLLCSAGEGQVPRSKKGQGEVRGGHSDGFILRVVRSRVGVVCMSGVTQREELCDPGRRSDPGEGEKEEQEEEYCHMLGVVPLPSI